MVKTTELNHLWGNQALDAGWTAIPNSLIFLQEEIGITSQELVIILNILMHRRSFSPKKLPYPSISSIARRTGQTPRNVRRHLANLEEKKLLIRKATEITTIHKGRNLYDLQPLIDILSIKTPELNKNLQLLKAKTIETEEAQIDVITPPL